MDPGVWGGPAGSDLLPKFARLWIALATADGNVPCIHENALLLINGLDNRRAEVAAGLAHGEHEGSDQHARDTCFVFAAVVDDGDRRGRARGRPPAVTDHGRSLARRLGGSRDPG
jgi:hypothetical protein